MTRAWALILAVCAGTAQASRASAEDALDRTASHGAMDAGSDSASAVPRAGGQGGDADAASRMAEDTGGATATTSPSARHAIDASRESGHAPHGGDESAAPIARVESFPTAELPAAEALAPHLRALGASKEWRRLLLYAPTWRGREVSLVDTPGFFLSPQGKTDPVAEILAAWDAMRAPVPAQGPDEHARCRFPARWRFLERHVPAAARAAPPLACPRYDGWRRLFAIDAVSLVFSSYYPNNPSSLFGHTFLRLHRRTDDPSLATGMLDDAVNYAAVASPDDNPLAYTLKGVAGGYPGVFSLTPYYAKIQEYANAESRDLWEYRLSFGPAEIDRVIHLVWEMQGQAIDYYYFDENCSAILLSLLEAARPSLNLVRFAAWVIPVDTVRAVAAQEGLVTDVTFRASSFRRFKERYAALSASERARLADVVTRRPPPPVLAEGMEPARQALFLDAVLEYVDFDEKLAGDRAAEKHDALRRTALLERSRVRVKPLPLEGFPRAERPDLGHGSSRFGLGLGGTQGDAPYVTASWRPALHDLLARADGFGADLSIAFFDTVLRWRPARHAVAWDRITVLGITSLPTAEWLVRKPAWYLDLGGVTSHACASGAQVCRRWAIQAGPGLTGLWADGRVISYAMTGLGLGVETPHKSAPYASPLLKAGALLRVTPAWRAAVEVKQQWDLHQARRPWPLRSGTLSLAYAPSSRWEWRVEATSEGPTREGSVTLFLYD